MDFIKKGLFFMKKSTKAAMMLVVMGLGNIPTVMDIGLPGGTGNSRKCG